MNRIKHIPREADWFVIMLILATCFLSALTLAGCSSAPGTPAAVHSSQFTVQSLLPPTNTASKVSTLNSVVLPPSPNTITLAWSNDAAYYASPIWRTHVLSCTDLTRRVWVEKFAGHTNQATFLCTNAQEFFTVTNGI